MDSTKSIIRACETVRNMGMQWEDLKLTTTGLDYGWPTLEKKSEQDEQSMIYSEEIKEQRGGRGRELEDCFWVNACRVLPLPMVNFMFKTFLSSY